VGKGFGNKLFLFETVVVEVAEVEVTEEDL
jgi:hypothetical protein